MRVKRFNKPFNQVVVSLKVLYQMDGNLWGPRTLPDDRSLLDCGVFITQKPTWFFRSCCLTTVHMYGSRLYRDGNSGSRESRETISWATEPIDLASLESDEARDSLMKDIEFTLYRAVARITHSTMGSREVRELGDSLGASELVRQRSRIALVKFLRELKSCGALRPTNVSGGKGVRFSKRVDIDDLDGNDSVEFVMNVSPHYEESYIKSFSSRFRRRHEKAQYKRLARRYKELNDKYKVIETKLKFAQSQYESMRSRFMACQKDLATQSADESEKTSQ